MMVAFPERSSVAAPIRVGPRFALTVPVGVVPVGVAPVVVGAATTTVNVTGAAKTEGLALEVTVMLTPEAVVVVDCACRGSRAAEKIRAETGAMDL
jgi:hypothetical protein